MQTPTSKRFSPLVRRPDVCAVMSPRYMASIARYAAMAAYGHVVVDASARYDKRAKQVHRCDIADTRGRLSLTVPVSVPHGLAGRMRWDMVRVSQHGEWWRLHRTALESAYGRTPYFEFLIDKFDAVLADPGPVDTAIDVIELDRRADAVVRSILGMDNVVEWSAVPDGMEYVDLRRFDFDSVQTPPYRQLRADRLGFVGGLSVLDLIFNLGPEAALYLHRLQDALRGLA